MKALLATTLLIGLSSFVPVHAEWEILDPGTAVAPNVTAPAPTPAPSVVSAPAPTVAAPTVATTTRAGVTPK